MPAARSSHRDGDPDPEAPLEVTIRPAEPVDAPAMGAVWHRAALVGYDGILSAGGPPVPSGEVAADGWRREIAARATGALVLVACPADPDRPGEPGGPVLGTIAVVPDAYDSSRGEVAGLYVDPGHWGRGIGGSLHGAALEHLRWAGYRMAMLWVLEGNVRARSMFERWGWRLTAGRRTDAMGVDELCYLRMP